LRVSKILLKEEKANLKNKGRHTRALKSYGLDEEIEL
jgi:hypothetical protein